MSTMKASEMTGKEIADWLHIDCEEDEISETQIERLRDIAIAYACKYTNQTGDYVNEQPEMSHAVLALVQDMYDNRALRVDDVNVNPYVQSILDLNVKMTL